MLLYWGDAHRFPELSANLVAGLADLQRDDLARHVGLRWHLLYYILRAQHCPDQASLLSCIIWSDYTNSSSKFKTSCCSSASKRANGPQVDKA
jgi:hypothetical protein